MEKFHILHMFTSAPNLSPFDANMAADAGWHTLVPYTSLEVGDIPGLVQDAMFSRSPSGVKRTGIFIGGRDMGVALQMLEEARKVMFPPFQMSVLADPSGAFTTAAGMIAAVGTRLQRDHGADWNGARSLILGGTGPVGMAAAILASELGASVTIMSRSAEKAQAAVDNCRCFAGGGALSLAGAADTDKAKQLAGADVVLATAAAGIEVLSAAEIAAAPALKVAADVNAVPPSGVAGLEAQHDGTPLPGSKSGAVGVGALAVGNIKYQVQHQLLRQMRDSDEPVYLHYESACEVARKYAAERDA